ncbi:Inositol-1-monophosphatase [hydrothermal vent metagenome]|uniref:Inositol-1-monophosphatase n=1 Tax=hydrothermal vent metagenome TaxID=652676 RepID=A0A3B1D7B7_9ZZZZ
MNELNIYLEVAVHSAKEAGTFLLNQFGEEHIPTYKSKADVSLDVDKESENIIIRKIRKIFPSHNIYSEELGKINNQSSFTWYIDPLDGTNNYFAGIPYFGVSIALVENSEILLGVVYNPVTDQLFSALKGYGAFLNGEKIKTSNENKTSYSILSFIKGHAKVNSTSDIEAQKIEQILSSKFSRVLKMWAPSLDWCLLALEKINVLISYKSEFEDMLAGLLIAQEAGIIIYNFDGKPYQSGNNKIIAVHDNSADDFLQLLKSF